MSGRKGAALQVLQATAFNKLPWLVHGFSTRLGGVSEIDGEKVLNLGAVEWDKRENVEENRRRFVAAAGAGDLSFVSLHQIHSDVVRIFDATPSKQCKGERAGDESQGIVARRPNGGLFAGAGGRSEEASCRGDPCGMARDAGADCREDDRADADGIRV